MIIGERLWHQGITQNMKCCEIDNRDIFTFENLPTNSYHSLINAVNAGPSKTAIINDDNKSYNFLELKDLVDRLSSVFMNSMNIERGDHVGLLLFASIEFVISYYALSKLGAICVPLPTKYKEHEVLSLIQKADLKCLVLDQEYVNYAYPNDIDIMVCDDKFIEKVMRSKKNEVKYVCSLEDDAVIMFTSGTTSQSKGVILKNYNIMHAIMVYQRLLDIKESDKTVIPVPIYHITGLVALLGLFIHSHAEIHLHKKYDARRILTCVKENKITFMHGSPTVFSKLLDLKDDFPYLPSLRSLGCGSSYTPLEKMKEFHKWLPYTNFHVIYGMTETASPALFSPNDSATSIYATAAGLAIPGMSMKIVDDVGVECLCGEVGSLLIKGANVITHYYKTESSDIDNDLWLDTGDMAFVNEDNYVFIVDRKKDMINRGGEKIWSRDVEEVILGFPGIEECAVVGIEDEIYGESAASVIVLKEGYLFNRQKFDNYLVNHLAKFKIPTQVLIVDEVLKTKGLKVDKKNIRKLFK